jgi:hypothetical protein
MQVWLNLYMKICSYYHEQPNIRDYQHVLPVHCFRNTFCVYVSHMQACQYVHIRELKSYMILCLPTCIGDKLPSSVI